MLELRALAKRLGAFHLPGLDLRVNPGEYFVLLGPSGVGKTVTLELIAGLLRPDSGAVLWDGRDMTHAPPEARGFALVYQDYALFPHLDAAANIAYGLRWGGLPTRLTRRAARARVEALAAHLHITDLLARMPATLSGGEQQRVALARALVIQPQLLLLDEPLAALDPPTRLRLRKELQRVQRETGTACLHVTHDAEEAMVLGDRIGVLLEQRVHQVGTAEELFRKPSDPLVAAFLGLRNVFAVRFVRPGVCGAGEIEILAAAAEPDIKHVWIKPEEIVLSRQPFDSSARNQFRGRVESAEPGRVLWTVHVACGPLSLAVLLTHSSFETLALVPGSEIYATFKSAAVHCF